MALLIHAGLQMIPRDIYEAAANPTASIPSRTFWRVTLPLVRPALMVAVIFRLLDAMRIFDLIYVLKPNSSQTKTISVLGPREPDRLRQVRLRLGPVDHAVPDQSPRRPSSTSGSARCALTEETGDAVELYRDHRFYLVAVIVRRLDLPVLLRDPDEHQIGHGSSRSTTCRSTSASTTTSRADHRRVLAQPRQLHPGGDIGGGAGAVPRGHRRLRAGPRQLAGRGLAPDDHPRRVDCSRRSRFRSPACSSWSRAFGVFNTPFALIFSYTIFTLPFTVWVLSPSCVTCRSRSRKRPSTMARRPG